MPKIEKKQVVINEIKEKLSRAKSVVLVNSRGLSVEQDTNLRRKLREASVDYKVYKNTMMTFAVEGTPFEGLKAYFEGPSAIAFCYEDQMAAAKTISKELKAMPKLEFKCAVIEGALYDGEMVKAIAEIPSKDVLYSKLLGSFKSPMSAFARVINEVAQKQA